MKVTVGPDPSLVYRPDVDPEVAKDKASFRNYTSGPLLDRVFTTYKLMHTHQTVDFVRSKHAQFGGFSYKKMTVMEAVDLLDGLLDESDPDVDFPNSFHAFQTAEGIRKAHPDKVPNLPCPSPSQTAAGVGPGVPPRGLVGVKRRGWDLGVLHGAHRPSLLQQVRPLHQVPGPAGRGQAAALLPGAH
uniref:Inositol oxygenase n=1 Tax=Colobus angolensis palliatus TaxID=336983 RepID=A0A2K5HRK8_COLAP